MFITLEGLDGSGKSTIGNMLKQYLITEGYDVLYTREPGGTFIAEQIRSLLLAKKNKMLAETEFLLYLASRNEHYKRVIWPNLQQKRIVISDRFLDSTLAYQGHARNLNIGELTIIHDLILPDCRPDLTLFFDIEPQIAQMRIAKRHESENNRFEIEQLAFHEKVYRGYQMIISAEPKRIKIVDASETIKNVYAKVLFWVDEKLKHEQNTH